MERGIFGICFLLQRNMMKDKYFSDICKRKQSINKNKKIPN